MHYYQHNIGDYARDTSHLTVVEHGIYRLLLDWCYLNEKPITTEKALRIGRGYPVETQSVLSEFFLGSGDEWMHKRVEDEVSKYQLKADRNRTNGSKGGRPPTQKNPVGSQPDSSGNPVVTLTKEPKNQEPEENLLPPGLTPGGDVGGAVDQDSGDAKPPRLIAAPQGLRFAEFWAIWPKNERKQDKAKCLAKWKLNFLDTVADLILADIRVKGQTKKWQDGFIEAPLVYLNGRRWEDGVEPQVDGEHVELGNWWDTKGGVQRRATELGIGPWEAVGPGGVTVPWGAYVNRVRTAAAKAGGQAS